MLRTTKRAQKSLKSTVSRASKGVRRTMKKSAGAIAVPKQHFLMKMIKNIQRLLKDSIAYIMKKEKQMLQKNI